MDNGEGEQGTKGDTQQGPPEIAKLFKLDGYLHLHEREINRRYGCFSSILRDIEQYEGGLDEFTKSYELFGIHARADGTVQCHEWAPAAQAVFLCGDFNNWKKTEYPFKEGKYGKWDLTIPPNGDGNCAIPHGSFVKVKRTTFLRSTCALRSYSFTV